MLVGILWCHGVSGVALLVPIAPDGFRCSVRYLAQVPPRIGTVLEDYHSFIIPNAQRHALKGHKGNIKSVSFCGEDGTATAIKNMAWDRDGSKFQERGDRL